MGEKSTQTTVIRVGSVVMLFAASIEIPLCKERFSAACSSANFLDSFICFSISLFLKA
ncbi:hypothetical protein HanPSC8_Chr11g0490091 [Helianthus annuus]|nr:hypothetical protein HanPSC8_Chr11g0490091 [Helianthus annuus]